MVNKNKLDEYKTGTKNEDCKFKLNDNPIKYKNKKYRF